MNVIKIIAAERMRPVTMLEALNQYADEMISREFKPRTIVQCNTRAAIIGGEVWVGLVEHCDDCEPAVYVSHNREMLHRQVYEHYRDLWTDQYKDQFPDESFEGETWQQALWHMEDVLLDDLTYNYYKVPVRG